MRLRYQAIFYAEMDEKAYPGKAQYRLKILHEKKCTSPLIAYMRGAKVLDLSWITLFCVKESKEFDIITVLLATSPVLQGLILVPTFSLNILIFVR